MDEQKQVEFYAASVNAAYNSALELDKSIFTISAGGIGLLMTLIYTLGVSSVAVLVIYVFALLSFASCIILILFILKKNIPSALNLAAGNNPNPILKTLDMAVSILFGIGILLSVILSFSIAVDSYVDKKEKLDGKKSESPQKDISGKSEAQHLVVELVGQSGSNLFGMAPVEICCPPAPPPIGAPPLKPRSHTRCNHTR